MVTIVSKPQDAAPAQAEEGLAGAGLEALDQIEREAQAFDAGAVGGAGVGPAAPPPPSAAAELLPMLQLLRGMAAPVFADWQEFRTVWSDQTLQAMADSGGAIMDRHGWTMGETMQQWGPYIALVAATAPPALATYAHIKHRKAQAAAAQRARAMGPAPAGQDGAES